MQQHGQAAAQRVDFLVFVKLHHGLLLCHTVVTVFFFDGLQFGRGGAHFSHRAVRGVGQRVEYGFDDNGQNDDCPAPVADNVVQLVQEPEEGGGEPVYFAVVFCQLQVVGDVCDDGCGLRAGVEVDGGFGFRAVLDGGKGNADAGAVQVVVATFDVDTAVACGANALSAFGLEDPGGHEVVFNHAEPAGLGFAGVFGFVFA